MIFRIVLENVKLLGRDNVSNPVSMIVIVEVDIVRAYAIMIVACHVSNEVDLFFEFTEFEFNFFCLYI